jgi:uncharacterized repeat protein (TIGR03843 family)
VDWWQPRVVSIEGRFVAASNTTLLGQTEAGERVVYKPSAGENPLWDFAAETLATREALTYEVSDAIGLTIVPETVLGDGLYGPGSIQRFVDVDDAFDPLQMARRGDPALWPFAVLDLVCNNADRKLGHILRRTDGELVAIDHGLTFHASDKLRTVLWVFAGKKLPADMEGRLRTFADEGLEVMTSRIRSLLSSREATAFHRRVTDLIIDPRHPEPPDDRPALPWPPY